MKDAAFHAATSRKVRWCGFPPNFDPEKAKLTVSLRFGLDVTLLEVKRTGGALLVGPVPEKEEE
jgi:hypothetical protein